MIRIPQWSRLRPGSVWLERRQCQGLVASFPSCGLAPFLSPVKVNARRTVSGGRVSTRRAPGAGRPSTTDRRKSGSRPLVFPGSSIGSSSMIGPYGLAKVDYSKPPPKWPLPPPPPSTQFESRYYPISVLVLLCGGAGYIFFNRDQNVYEYWRLVEQGNVPLGDDDDDDDDDNDDDE